MSTEPNNMSHSDANDSVKVYSSVVALVSLLVYTPIAIYGLFKFYTYRNNIIIKKRYPQITFVVNALLIIVIITEGLRAHFQAFHIEWQWWTFHPIIAFLSSVAGWFTLRTFLNYYAIHYSNAMMTSEWKKIINPDTVQTNWFILNRRKYGSYTFWKPIAIGYTVFNVFICYLWEVTHSMNLTAKNSILNWVGICNAILAISFMAVIRSKTPQFNDVFNQRMELKRIILFASIVMILKICLHFSHFFIKNKQINHSAYITEAWLFSTLSVHISYTTTIWVIKENRYWLERIRRLSTADPQLPMPLNLKLASTTKSASKLALKLEVGTTSTASPKSKGKVTPSPTKPTMSNNTTDNNRDNSKTTNESNNDNESNTKSPSSPSLPLPKLDLDKLAVTASNNNHEIYHKAVRSLDRQQAHHSQEIKVQQVEMTLDGILTLDMGFEALLFHIAQEFSMEIMLSLIEMTQFQQLLYKYYTQHFQIRFSDDEQSLSKKGWISMPLTVPKSAIVHTPKDSESKSEGVKGHKSRRSRERLPQKAPSVIRVTSLSKHDSDKDLRIDIDGEDGGDGDGTNEADATDGAEIEIVYSDGTKTETNDNVTVNKDKMEMDYLEFIKKAEQIYKKYIKIGSELEINVSYKVRNAVTNKLKNITAIDVEDDENRENMQQRFKQLYDLFTPSMDNLYMLLVAAFVRFKKSKLFEQLIVAMNQTPKSMIVKLDQ